MQRAQPDGIHCCVDEYCDEHFEAKKLWKNVMQNCIFLYPKAGVAQLARAADL